MKYFGLIIFLVSFLMPSGIAYSAGTINEPELTDAEKNGLLKMREEEQLAQDVYHFLYEKWGLNIFSNIAKSEQKHCEAIKSLLDHFGLEDPLSSGSVNYTKQLVDLHESLIIEGSKSIEDAIRVGLIIEDLDIADLDNLLETTKNEDIRIVYENLNRGSHNHLRAFSSLAPDYDINYIPTYISQERFDGIINNSGSKGGKKLGRKGKNKGPKSSSFRKGKKQGNCSSSCRNASSKGKGSCKR